jgi:hypothetical protein
MMNVAGNGHRQSYNARIVGYTDRLNTILVPESFLKEANDRFATTSNEAPSRLIVTVNSDKGKNDFLDFLAQKGYRIEGDTESLKLQTLVNGILWVVIGIGGIVSILAFSLLLISILLLIEKNREKFVNLYSMGYSVPQIARPYTILVAMVDGIVWLIAIALVSLAYPRLFAFISVISPDLQLASLLPLWLVAVAFAVVFILFHRWMIIRQLRKICE